MSASRLEILPHTSGWIFKFQGVESAPYPTEQLARRAGTTAAFLSAVPEPAQNEHQGIRDVAAHFRNDRTTAA
ncbi:hypothetical protein [Pararhizobium sp.]|uniref:hypothetical protein n=1 Tax=Pararhizobium sp. TaxID=1977563 RepID=UPI0027268DD6|nr:hypothetical protein [Pararhizobium sp.]MDO9416366.1 hypothetical protein [Pararhizobium sp.]